MIEIPLNFERNEREIEEGLKVVETRISLPTLIVARQVYKESFIVDTGSPYSFLNIQTFNRLSISKGKIKVKNMLIGANIVDLYEIPQISLYLLSKTGEIVKIISKCFSVAVYKKQKYQLPNIIGLDFLEEQKFKLVIDFQRSEFKLVKEEFEEGKFKI